MNQIYNLFVTFCHNFILKRFFYDLEFFLDLLDITVKGLFVSLLLELEYFYL